MLKFVESLKKIWAITKFLFIRANWNNNNRKIPENNDRFCSFKRKLVESRLKLHMSNELKKQTNITKNVFKNCLIRLFYPKFVSRPSTNRML